MLKTELTKPSGSYVEEPPFVDCLTAKVDYICKGDCEILSSTNDPVHMYPSCSGIVLDCHAHGKAMYHKYHEQKCERSIGSTERSWAWWKHWLQTICVADNRPEMLQLPIPNLLWPSLPTYHSRLICHFFLDQRWQAHWSIGHSFGKWKIHVGKIFLETNDNSLIALH